MRKSVHPSDSKDAAAAFFESRRPGAKCEKERFYLLNAFYPLRAHSPSLEALKRGLKDLRAAHDFLEELERTEAAFRLRNLSVSLVRKAVFFMTGSVIQLIKEDQAQPPAKQRRGIDRGRDNLRAVVNVYTVAALREYRAPSIKELIALAVLQGIEKPTGARSEGAHARLEEKWKKTRARARLHFQGNRPSLLNARRNLEGTLSHDALDDLERAFSEQILSKGPRSAFTWPSAEPDPDTPDGA
jgi:hypothetical protein